MEKKSRNVDKKQITKKSKVEEENDDINKEIELEQTHPGKIITDEMKYDDKHPSKIGATVDDQKSNRLLFTTIIVVGVTLLLLIVGTQFLPKIFNNSRYTYNGFEFIKNPESETWFTTFKIGDKIYPLPFHYAPRDLEDIPININKKQLLNNDFVYLALPPMEDKDPQDVRRLALAAIEVGKIIGTKNGIYNIPTKTALTRPVEVETNDTANIPIVGCGVATNNTGVIIFQYGSYTAVFENSNNCYIVQGPTGTDVVKASDRLVYDILGIMLSE